MSSSSVQDGHKEPAITDRSFNAVFGDTGLEPVVDRERCEVGTFNGGDETWGIEVTVVLRPQRPGVAGQTFTIVVGGGTVDDHCEVWLSEGAPSWTKIPHSARGAETRFIPEHGPAWRCSIVDVLFEGVRLMAPTILERAIAG